MSETPTADEKYLRDMVEALVDKPEAVSITRSVDEMGVLLTLSIDKDDMGKVIGRSGNTAKAIRTLLRVVGMRTNARVNLKILEPAGSTFNQTRETSYEGGGQEKPVMKDIDAAIADL